MCPCPGTPRWPLNLSNSQPEQWPWCSHSPCCEMIQNGKIWCKEPKPTDLWPAGTDAIPTALRRSRSRSRSVDGHTAGIIHWSSRATGCQVGNYCYLKRCKQPATGRGTRRQCFPNTGGLIQHTIACIGYHPYAVYLSAETSWMDLGQEFSVIWISCSKFLCGCFYPGIQAHLLCR